VHPYVGAGAFAAFASDHHVLGSSTVDYGIGVRVPAGLYWAIPRSPVALFLEIAPGLTFAPATVGILSGGIGALYYF